jgi:hypothetical protein
MRKRTQNTNAEDVIHTKTVGHECTILVHLGLRQLIRSDGVVLHAREIRVEIECSETERRVGAQK